MSVIAWVFLAVAGVMGGLALLALLQILVALLVWAASTLAASLWLGAGFGLLAMWRLPPRSFAVAASVGVLAVSLLAVFGSTGWLVTAPRDNGKLGTAFSEPTSSVVDTNTALPETDSDYEILLNLDRPSTVDALSKSLGRPLSPLGRSAFGWTDLHYAAILDLPELAEELMDSGANPDAMYNSVELLESGVYDAIKSLVSFDSAFYSGLFVLKERCHLAESGAWAAAPRVTPLMLAALFGHVEVMVALLDHGADVGDALRAAVCGGATQTALWLLSRRVEVDPDELEDATHQAALGDRPEILLALFERAPRLRSKEHVEHLLFDAAQRNSADVLSALLARGANPDARNDAARAPGTTPLHFAAEAGTPRSVVVLLEHGADIDSRADGGRTPLHWAMRAIGNTATSPPVVAELLARGADVDARDSVGTTPLHVAIGEYWWGGAEVLLDNGADVNAEDSQGRTPLHTVSSAEAVAGLLRHGADLHARDATGNTPLHLHVAPDYFSANVEAVMELLKGGADVNARNDAGDTPLALAADDELRAVLRRYGAEWE